jgi:hypothetical protein
MDSIKKVATIRKWFETWGVAHSFANPNTPPQKFFVHVNNRLSPETALGLDVKISFVQGEPRTLRELPQALEIEAVPQVLLPTAEVTR